MKKQEMIDAITTKLSSFGVFTQESTTTDIEIQAEFLDAKWSTGKKKIIYTALALLNEEKKTLYFWELRKETSSGLSLGSKKTFQSGATVYRQVKSTGYGPDGKAYEYDLDIGDITRTFKETAKDEGWKFKVVFNKKKASYK